MNRRSDRGAQKQVPCTTCRSTPAKATTPEECNGTAYPLGKLPIASQGFRFPPRFRPGLPLRSDPAGDGFEIRRSSRSETSSWWIWRLSPSWTLLFAAARLFEELLVYVMGAPWPGTAAENRTRSLRSHNSATNDSVRASDSDFHALLTKHGGTQASPTAICLQALRRTRIMAEPPCRP